MDILKGFSNLEKIKSGSLYSDPGGTSWGRLTAEPRQGHRYNFICRPPQRHVALVIYTGGGEFVVSTVHFDHNEREMHGQSLAKTNNNK